LLEDPNIPDALKYLKPKKSKTTQLIMSFRTEMRNLRHTPA